MLDELENYLRIGFEDDQSERCMILATQVAIFGFDGPRALDMADMGDFIFKVETSWLPILRCSVERAIGESKMKRKR